MFIPTEAQKESWKRGRILDYWEYLTYALTKEQSNEIQEKGFLVYKIRDPLNVRRDRFLIRVPGVSLELAKQIYQLQIHSDLTDRAADDTHNRYAFSGQQVHLYNMADVIPYTPPTVLKEGELPEGIEIPGFPIDAPSFAPAVLLPEEQAALNGVQKQPDPVVWQN